MRGPRFDRIYVDETYGFIDATYRSAFLEAREIGPEGSYVITEVTRWGTDSPTHQPSRSTPPQPEPFRKATDRFFHPK